MKLIRRGCSPLYFQELKWGGLELGVPLAFIKDRHNVNLLPLVKDLLPTLWFFTEDGHASAPAIISDNSFSTFWQVASGLRNLNTCNFLKQSPDCCFPTADCVSPSETTSACTKVREQVSPVKIDAKMMVPSLFGIVRQGGCVPHTTVDHTLNLLLLLASSQSPFLLFFVSLTSFSAFIFFILSLHSQAMFASSDSCNFGLWRPSVLLANTEENLLKYWVTYKGLLVL